MTKDYAKVIAKPALRRANAIQAKGRHGDCRAEAGTGDDCKYTNFGLIGFAMTPTLFGETAQVGQAERNASAQPIAFTHTTLIDMTGAPLQSDMTVLVVGNLIAAIGKNGKVRVPRNAKIVDAAAKT